MGSAYADEVDAPDPTFDDPIHLADAKQDGPVTVKRSGPDTRAVVPDNSAYVKINAKGDGTDNALALGDNSIAIGSSAKTRPSTSGLGGAVAVGTAATAAGNNVAFGANASALGDEGAVALGAGANAAGKSSIALGNEAQATGWGAYALGRKAKATAESALAIGDSSMATRTGTMAIGSQAAAAAENAIAIGQSSAARGTDSLALGSYSEANRDQTVSVGTAGFERQIVNVGRGTQATDAVNVAQLKGVTDALGGNAAVGADGNIKKPAYTIGSKTYDNVGDALLAVSASGGAENAVEYDSTAKDSVTLGGTGAAAAKLTNVRAGTLSSNSTDAVNGAQLFGTNNRVTKVEQSLTDSGLIDPSTGESLAVVYKDATKSTVALGGTGGTVVTNVKAGKVAPASKDAVNGSQLYDVSASVASALGGESAVNADGTLSKPTYKVGDKTYNNVGDALQAAATSGGAGGEDVNAVHYDGANKSSVTLGGTGASSPVSLKNVATGQAATDAVNVAQLQSGLSDVKDEIKQNLGDGTLDMKYIKVRATGMQANALGKNSVAIGSQANATNVDTLAIGSGSRASGMNSIAIGVNSVAASADTVSIGDVGATRRIVNVSDGVDDTDAVNMKQLTDAMHSANTKLDAKMMRMTRDVESKPGSFVAIEGLGADGSLPNIASMNGRDPKLGTAAAIGVASGAGGINSVAVGLQAVSSSDYAVAIGSVAQTGVEQPYSVAMGSMVTTNGAGALAIGSRAKANADNAVAVGNNGVVAVGKSSIAIGDKAMTAAGTVNSVAMGKSANVAQNVTDAIALGANANVASGNNGGIALGANSVADRGNALSVGSNSLQRQIVNVAKGTKNNDAVNVSQLTGVTTALGGGAGIDADGTVKAPTYKVGDTTYNNVGDALDAMAKNGGSDPNAVAYDSDVKDKVTLAGKTGTTLTNVKAGALSATSTDAVNGSQLFATNESLGNLKDALKDGGVVDETTGESLAVVYDGTSKDKVTLAGKTGTTLSNVKAGTADLDAVNVSQLKASGLIGVDGKSIAAVTYDKKADGTPNYGSVTLGDGKSTGPVTLSNVAKGTAGTDAVNVDQLTKAISEVEGGLNPLAVAYDSVTKDKVTLAGKTGTTLTNLSAGKVSADSKDAVNGSQLYDTAQSVADTLGGGSTVDANGKVKAPTYSLTDPADSSKQVDYHNVGSALENLDDRVAGNTGDITHIKNQFTNTGLVDGDGDTRAAVTYDKNADGTANYKSATLAGEGGTTLTNVKAGALSATSTDAVNGSQLFATNESLGNLKDALKDGGVVDETTGESLAVVYDGTSKDKVTLAGKTGTTLSNVRAGTADLDAVNVSQLKASGLIGVDGKSIAAVTYDKKADGTPNYGSVTLGDGKSTGPVTLSNVAKGTAGTDAVNVDQLTKAISEVEGGLNPLAVAYDSVTKDKVTLAGKTGTTLSNVKAGTADLDAVNVSQLKSSGLIGDDGKSRAAVTYDKNADGTANYKSATLAGEGGTKLSNVKAGTADMDAVNVSQLKSSGLVGEDGKARAAVTYDKNADGTPNYKSATLAGEGGTKLSNVKAGTADMDAVNVSQLKSSGLVGEDGKSRAAVTYDKNADGTANYKSATLAGEGGTTLANVAAGKADRDAVNVSQLKSSGLIGEDGKSRAAVTYDKNADGTPNYKSATLAGEGGTTLANVKAGTADMDAVNVSQLKSSGLIGEDGKSRVAVTYDKNADGTANYKSVTLAGEGGTTLANVAAGKADRDAVNVSQLKSSGLIGEDGKSRAAVTYDKNADGTANYKSATLAGEGGTTLANVAAGKADRDAVNVSQLKSSGLIGEDGKSRAAVTYDKNADGTANYKSATLAGEAGTKLANVKAGTADMDAVNVSQLKSSGLIGEDGKSRAAVTYDKNADGTANYKTATLAGEGGTTLTNVKAGALSATSTDAVNGSQLFATNESLGNLKDALKDGGVVDETTGESLAVVYDGTSKDKVTLAGKTGTTLSNVKAGTADLDAVNVSQLKASGLIGVDGKSIAAVTYDKKADGTPNYGSVTLGDGKSTGPVMLSNVAKGTAGTDAVNVDQLNDLEDSLVNGAIKLKYIKVNSEGRDAIARGPESVAIGANAWATRPQAMALGSGSRANGANSVAIGFNSVADDDNTVAVGNVGEERRIVHVANGVDDTDAVNMKQLTDAMHTANTKLDAKMTRMTRDVESKPGGFVAIEGLGSDGSMPNIASMNGRDPRAGTAAAIGVGSGASGINSISVGLQAVANSDNSVAIGSIAQTGVEQPYAVAMGSMVTTNGAGALAIGSRAKANAENAVAVGNNGVTAVGKSSIAIGDKALTKSGAVNSIAIGTNANVQQNVVDAIALGANSQAQSSNSIALGANSIANRANALSIGTAGAERQIVHVAKGTQDTDAVSLAQLKGLANVVGGGTGFDTNGDVTAPTYTIDGKEYHNVNDALQAAAKSGGDGSSGTDPNAVAYDGDQKDKVTLAGQNGTTLSNVAAGKVDTDAVNVSQLKSSGLIDKDGNAVAAMTYDKNADGTPNYKSATLAGEGGTKLSNVAAGTLDTDAVNVSQLKSSGLIGENGKALAAVTYDTHADGTTNFASVTFGGANAGMPVALHNVAAGKASTDAVNVSQLTGVTDIIGGGAGVDANGKVTAPVYNVDGKDYASVGDAIKALEQREGGNGTNPNAVVYDNATKAAVTLAGTNGTVIRNVADGSLALDSTEAVNGGQLNFAASSIADSLGGGAKFDPTTGDIEAPTYELTAADGLKNTYDNVGDAFKHVDERVTTHTAQIETLQQGVANAVQYDDATHASVTLGGVGVAPVMLKNVADGVDETDAVNVRQLRSAGLVGEDGKLQSAVVYDKNADGTTNYGSVTLGGKGASAPVALHNVAAGTAKTDAVNVSQLSGVTDALGGGAKVDETTGEIVAPTYNVGDKTFHNAGDALTNIDNRVSQIQNNLGETTKLVGAVAYDKNGDGTVNWGKVTLGNGPSSGPVVLTNVENGKSRYDAVNYGQFSDLQGRVDKIDDRLTTMTTPGDGNGGKPGTNGNDLIQGTGGSGKDSAEIVAAKPGTGNGNIAVGSGAQVADAKNNGTAIGAGSKVQADDGTALGHGATVSSGATNSVALGSGSKATEANTVSFGSDGHERRLVNVADGINKTDAVNRGQLDRAIGGMQGQINDMSRNAYSGIAAATALTMIPGVDPGKTLSFGVAGASYKGYQAVAMGGEARITENLKMRAGVSLSSGGNTFGAGASYQW
ncbi:MULTISPECIES: YadA-like family protein [Burkholderia]|nr:MULTISPECIES: YadA-like family protein [Burkholderia]